MENNLSISYVVPAYNSADTITDSLESIINGNLQDGDEIIVVNDASTDNTGAIISELRNRHSFLIVLNHKHNKGSAAASRNTAIDCAKNNYIFCLDSDNILVPHSVHKLRDYMIDHNADIASFGELHFFKNNIGEINKKWIFDDEYDFGNALNEPKFPGSSGNYLFTKTSWLKAGRYNESVGGAYDSWAFGISQLASGSRMVTMKDSFYFHRVGHESTFVKDYKKFNSSLLALRVITPYLDLIMEDDIEYIMSLENRYNWFENIEKHPLKTKQMIPGDIKKTIVSSNKTKLTIINVIKNKVKTIFK
jgi:glycosyltransferase involved in cell wall biosynthesis